MFGRYEDERDHLATPQEAVAEWARNIGGDGDNATKAWLLHDWDVWVQNPHYAGPAVPHPESDEPWDTDGDTSKWNENGEGQEAENDRYAARAYPNDVSYDDDEIPF
jgi:hypothetical protein